MSLLGADFDDFFADAIDALKPYLDDIVCIGGCANALYRFHDLASDVMWGYLGTKDVDTGVPQKLPLHGRPPVSQLMKDIGFKELTVGNADEAVIKYGPTDEESAADLEFLCDLSGLPKADQGRAAVSVQEGLYAQPLRYLAMSMQNNWHVDLGLAPGFGRFQGTLIKVPNPAAYVVSKVLIRGEQRKPASMEKDCFYIYEVSVVFRDALDAIREEYDRLQPCTPKWKKRFAHDARELFGSDTATGPVSAVGVYRDLGQLRGESFDVNEEIVQRSVAKMLDAMLG
jgi:hypothetical protein